MKNNSKTQFLVRVTTPVILVILTYIFAVFTLILPAIETSIYDFKKETLKELVESTSHIITSIHKRELSGELTTDQAQSMAKNIIKKIRYGKDNKEYFWINDLNQMVIMHPYRTELDGTSVKGLSDKNGVFLFEEFVKVVKKEGQGFVSYNWQLHDQKDVVLPKISYVKGTSWDWILGTGIYVDDVEKIISDISSQLIKISLLIIICIVLVLVYSHIQNYKIENQRQDLEKKNKELSKLNNMKNRLFSIIAHDLRNPMGAICSLSDLLIDDLNEPDKNIKDIKLYSNRIHYSTKTIMQFLDGLLKWAQIQSESLELNFETFNLSDVIDETFELLRENAKDKSITLIKEGQLEAQITTDKNMLKTVVRNLVSNAIKFTEDNGKVTVSVQEENQNFYLNVIDTGVGMSQEVLNKLFTDKNSTLGTKNEEGSGLGLIICQDFLTNTGGKLEIDSELDKGSTFTIILPKVIKN